MTATSGALGVPQHAVAPRASVYRRRVLVAAEGIEREEQLVRLRELGCRLGQGFYFSPPVPASGAVGVLDQRWTMASRMNLAG